MRVKPVDVSNFKIARLRGGKNSCAVSTFGSRKTTVFKYNPKLISQAPSFKKKLCNYLKCIYLGTILKSFIDNNNNQ